MIAFVGRALIIIREKSYLPWRFDGLFLRALSHASACFSRPIEEKWTPSCLSMHLSNLSVSGPGLMSLYILARLFWA